MLMIVGSAHVYMEAYCTILFLCFKISIIVLLKRRGTLGSKKGFLELGKKITESLIGLG